MLSDEEFARRHREQKKKSNQSHYERNKEKYKERARLWKLNNPEKVLESNRRTIARRRATDAELRERERQRRKEDWAQNKEARQAAYKAWYERNRGYHTEWARKKRDRYPATYLRYRAKIRAKAQGLPFDLTTADILVPKVCPVLGMPLKIGGGQGLQESSPSLDRVIPELGYVRGNVRVISHRANRLKDNATAEELEAVVRYIREETARVKRELGS